MSGSAEPGVLVQEVVYAGLDGLRAMIPLDLCACLHTARDDGPQLYLRAPDLSSMDAGEAFTLFTTLRDVLASAAVGAGPGTIPGFDAWAVTTEGRASRSLVVAGRRTTPLTEVEREVTTRLAEALGAACHAVEATTTATVDRAPLRLSVTVGDAVAHAEVTVPTAGTPATGRADHASPTTAVALATLDAVDPALKLGEAVDGEVGGERAILVLVRGEDGRAAAGVALTSGDPLHAAGVATLDAAARLQR